MATEQRAHSSASNVSDVGTRMSEQQLRDLRQIFDWIDVSGDNSIAAPELLVALKAASSDRATIEEAENLIRTHAGANRSTLGWFEFLNIFETSLAHSETHSSAAKMYELLEERGTGQLGPAALRAALVARGCDASDQAIDKMIRYIDSDNDGQVSLQEVRLGSPTLRAWSCDRPYIHTYISFGVSRVVWLHPLLMDSEAYAFSSPVHSPSDFCGRSLTDCFRPFSLSARTFSFFPFVFSRFVVHVYLYLLEQYVNVFGRAGGF